MITKEELNGLFKDAVASVNHIPMTRMAEIMSHIPVTLDIDKDSQDYVYKINTNEILESNMEYEDLEKIKEEGWSFGDNGENLVIFLKNQ